MADYSLVPVDHQPDFENVSLVPVEHDPFAAAGVAPPLETQPAPQPQPQPQNPAQQPGDMSAPAPSSRGDIPSFGSSLLHGVVNAVPGAYYAGLAQQQFHQGNYGAAAVYGAAALGDAALGAATLGASTRLGAVARATETALTAEGQATGRAAGVTAEGAAPAAVEAIENHHPWPKYLGGPVEQELVALPKSLHQKFHRELDEELPRWKGTTYYVSRSPAERQQDLQYLAKYTKEFDAEHGTKIYDALLKNGFPEP
jgi:hypothetical protein